MPDLFEYGSVIRLVITDKGVKRWAVRVTIGGRRVERGLGVWPTVGLDEARTTAEKFRAAAKQGRDARNDLRL